MQNNKAHNFFNLIKIAQFTDQPLGEGFDSSSDVGVDQSLDFGDSSSDDMMGLDAEQGVDENADMMSEEPSNIDFQTPEELKSLLDENAENPEFLNEILKISPADEQEFVKDSLQRYYEPERDEADKTIISAEVYKSIHGRGKGEQEVPATYTKASIMNLIRKTNASIEKFAKQAAGDGSVQKTAKSYNLKKQAQAYGRSHMSEFLNYGPDSARMLPYSNTGLVGNDWHVWIRGRDHNFIFDDHAVDFETFWRGNIMDKYSRPYRNEKGEYVGGYINKRFEVDRNIPEGNNLQLLPGQTRRPYIPEWSTLEARMTAARSKMAEDRGYTPSDTAHEPNDPYVFKSASVKKK